MGDWEKIIEGKLDHLVAKSEGLYELKEIFLRDRVDREFTKIFDEANPLVSICIATCNRAALLIERCINSLLRQTYRNLQIVVVGDHCTDETEYMLAKLGDSRIVFENLPKRGPYPRSAADRWRVAGTMPMNRALQLAEGAYIAHLDDDDEATSERIEVLVERARTSRAEFLWHKFLYQDGDGIWATLATEQLALGSVSTGSIFYHRYFAKIPWDVHAYRMKEPGDWNRIRKIKFLTPRTEFVDRALMIHYREQSQVQFVPQANETFLEV